MSQVENDKMELQQLQKLNEAARKAESFSSACIYRVPDDLQKLNKDAYNPSAIAIGPVHRDKFLQTPLQQVKLSYTKNLLNRLPLRMEDQQKLTAGMEEESAKQKMVELAIQKRLTVLLECMKTLVDEAKKCYAEEVTLDEKMMSEMMVFDGCFILEFLYRYRTRTYTGPDRDPIFCNSLTFANVRKDLVLLENQIPFFVLEKLFQLTVGQIPNRPNENWSLSDYVGWCYRKWMSPLPNSDNSSSSSAQCYHILHNIHNGCLPHDQTEQEKFNYREMPAASELVYAGVKFVPDPGNDLFKFKFSEPKGLFRWCHRAHFEIPPLAIYDTTESYLRNLIALEQSCPGISLHVSSYASVMDSLVNTDKDIQALEKAGVLTNCLGATQDATNLFNNLCKEIMEGGYFADTCREATEYSKRFWPKNMAHVRGTYFASPWTFIAFCAGFIVFIMTVLQFVHDFFKKSG